MFKYLKSIFKIRGRLNRLPYVGYSIILILVSELTVSQMENLQKRLTTIIGSDINIMSDDDFANALLVKMSESDLDIMVLSSLLLFGIYVLTFIGLSTVFIRRLHDLNLSGWY